MKKKFSTVLMVLSLIALSSLAPITARAATYNQNLAFSTTGQSIWGAGAAAIGSLSHFLGTTWGPGTFTTPQVLFQEAAITTDGRVGLQVDASWNSGSVDVDYPVGVELSFPDPLTVAPGDPYTISSSWSTNPGVRMATTSPNVTLTADAIFDVFFKARHVSCAFPLGHPCGTGIIGEHTLDVDTSLNLINIGPGSSVALSVWNGVLGFNARMPLVDTTDLIPDGSGNLHASGNDRFLDIALDLDAVATNLAGLPPLEGNMGPLHYNIFDADLTLGADLTQSFDFDPNLLVNLNMGGGVHHTMTVGSSLSFTMPNDPFSITPTFGLDNTFTNNSGLGLVPGFHLSGLELSGQVSFPFLPPAQLSLGPLFSVSPSFSLPPISIFNQSFPLAFADLAMPAFDIVPFSVPVIPPVLPPAGPPPAAPVPEPATLALLGSGLILLMFYQRRRQATVVNP